MTTTTAGPAPTHGANNVSATACAAMNVPVKNGPTSAPVVSKRAVWVRGRNFSRPPSA